MDDFDFGRVLNYFYVFFVVILIAIIVFFSRIVSIMIAERKSTTITSANAQQIASHKTYLEDAYTITVRLTQLAELRTTTDSPPDAGQLEILTTLAQGRKQALLAVVEEDPHTVQATVFPSELRESLPEETRIFIERKGTVEGSIIRLGSQDESTSENEVRLTVSTPTGERFMLYFSGDVPNLQSGSRVLVDGIILDNRLIVESVKQI